MSSSEPIAGILAVQAIEAEHRRITASNRRISPDTQAQQQFVVEPSLSSY
ncbi:MAG TPA: hypothetical protein VLA84_00310 [Microcoleus sp.]|nr:hypothetical protein [Microcoleus sp.]